VLAVDETVAEGPANVAFVSAPSAPFHDRGTVKVVTGGIQTVEPAAMVIDAICVMTSGAVKYEHSRGNALSAVYLVLVDDAVKTPDAITGSTSLTDACIASVELHP
jgi:hypothetical protein